MPASTTLGPANGSSQLPMTTSTRRSWLQTVALACGTAAIVRPGFVPAAEPIQRPPQAKFKLSLAAYSVRQKLLDRRPMAEHQQHPYTMFDFLDYCAELQLDGAELTSYYFPVDATPEYLLAIKEKAFRLGLDISGTAIGNDFCLPMGEARDRQLELTRTWIDRAAILGAPVIRIFAGNVPAGENPDPAVALESTIDRCAATINEALDYAATKGVYLALENHGGITATPEQMLRIIRKVKPSPWFGVNLDGGNFHSADPYADLAQIAPYTVNAQIKVEMVIQGKRVPADLARVLKMLHDAHYRGYVVLEYESAEDSRVAIPRYLKELRSLMS